MKTLSRRTKILLGLLVILLWSVGMLSAAYAWNVSDPFLIFTLLTVFVFCLSSASLLLLHIICN